MTDTDWPLPDFNPNARPQIHKLGDEPSTVLIVDDLLTNADVLWSHAVEAQFGPPKVTGYPGLNAAVPAHVLEVFLAYMRAPLAQLFDVPREAPLACHGHFGIICTPQEGLAPRQRLPQVDTTQPSLALLLYLGRPEQGGTGFFRHVATGFETITRTRQRLYETAIQGEMARGAPLVGYPTATAPGFELIGKSEAAFNRLVVYRGNLLHSALVDPAQLSADPREGRLTLNVFVTVKG